LTEAAGGAVKEQRPEEIEVVQDGRADGRCSSPLGQGEELVAALKAIGEQGGEQEQAIACDLELGQPGDGFRGADLTFGDTDKGFLVAVVTLDLPAIDVGLNNVFKGAICIGAD
jgi:hypothetical protein